MTNAPLTPALTAEEWVEWREYRENVRRETRDPERAAFIALQTMARNNDLLPDDSAYKFTRATIHDLHAAADCLQSTNDHQAANSLLQIARMLEATVAPE